MSGVTLLAFTVLKIFPPMIKAIELHGCMLFFAAVCIFGAFITIFFIPETKGKSLIEIEKPPLDESNEMLHPEGNKTKIVPAQRN